MKERSWSHESEQEAHEGSALRSQPGKRTLTMNLPRWAGEVPAAVAVGAAPPTALWDDLTQQPVQRKATAPLPGHPGHAMDEATSGSASEVPYRAEMETAFGVDFGGVQAFLGQGTAMDAMNANAAARGETVAFADGAPSKELVAHELTHVLQSRTHGAGDPQRSALESTPGDAAEAQADSVAAAFAAGDFTPARTVGGGGAVAGASVMRVNLRNTYPNWQDAKAAVAHKWDQLAARQTSANLRWLRLAEDTDSPPPAEAILIGAITGAVIAATAAIGGAIAASVTASASIIRAVSEMAKGTVRSATSRAAEAMRSGGIHEAGLAFQAAADEMVNTAWGAQYEATLALLGELDDAANKYEVAQDMYDALERSRQLAFDEQLNAMIDGWFTLQAQVRMGTDRREGPGLMDDLYDPRNRERWITSTDEGRMARDPFQTSLTGVLGLHIGPQNARPGAHLSIQYAEIDGGEANTEAIRALLLPRRIRDIRMPKVIVAESFVADGYQTTESHYDDMLGRDVETHYEETGAFSISLDERNSFGEDSMRTVSAGRMRTDQMRESLGHGDSGPTDFGRVWLAQRALGRTDHLSDAQIRANWQRGAQSVVQHMLGTSLADNGITAIDT